MPDQQMLIDYVPGEECRIAVVEDGKLDEYYHERASNESHVSNIYQGVVTNVETSISAAFIDFGLERNGFLHITDVHPKYFPGEDREAFETVGHKTRHGDRPGIEKCFKKGDLVTVQVLKEGIGNKGPTVTSYLSIPGRFLVMMPDMQQLGVSRKVEDEDERREMKKLLKSLEPPKEFGFIIRTAGMGQSKVDLKKDLSYLVRLWKDIEERVAEGGGGGGGGGNKKKKGRRRARVTRELYTESDLVIRTIRDVFTPDIDRVVINHPDAARRAHDFLSVSNPRAKSKVVFYDDPVPLFHRFGLERQIENIGSRTVELPSGGALVIDPTEALVAVDVNSGRSRSAKTCESNAFETNKEAVDEVARQLRLRDLGGLVVLDLIDMYQQRHRRAIEGRLKKNFLKDKARTRVGGISEFGMLELTRQRMRGSLTETVHQECQHCGGRGHTKSVESVVLNVMRQLAMVMQQPQVARLELTISPDVAFHMLNRKRAELVALEAKWQKAVTVRVGGGSVDYVQVAPLNEQGATLAPTAASGIPPETDNTFRDVSSLEDADLESWGSVELSLDAPDVLGGHAEAGGIDDAAEPSEVADEEPRRERSSKGRGRGRDRGREDADEDVSEDHTPPETSRGGDEEDQDSDDRPKRRRRRRGRNRGEDDGSGDGDSGSENQNSGQNREQGGEQVRESGDRDGHRRPEPPRETPTPKGPHLDPVLGFEFDPDAHPLDRARAYAEHRLATGAGDGPLSPAGVAAKQREERKDTASVPLGGKALEDVAVQEPAEESDADGSRGEGRGRGNRNREDREARAAESDANDENDGRTDADPNASGEASDGPPKRKRRRRRRGKRNGGDGNSNESGGASDSNASDSSASDSNASDNRPRDEHGDIDGNVRGAEPDADPVADDDDDRGNRRDAEPEVEAEPKPKKRAKREKQPKREKRTEAEAEERTDTGESTETEEAPEPEPEHKPKPRRKRTPKKKPEPAASEAAAEAEAAAEDAAPPKKKRRSRRKPAADADKPAADAGSGADGDGSA